MEYSRLYCLIDSSLLAICSYAFILIFNNTLNTHYIWRGRVPLLQIESRKHVYWTWKRSHCYLSWAQPRPQGASAPPPKPGKSALGTRLPQAPVVQTLDSSRYYIHLINHYPSGRFIQWIALSTFWTTGARSSSGTIELFLQAQCYQAKTWKRATLRYNNVA